MNIDVSIFDSLLEPTFVINHKAKVLYCNEAGALISGVSARRLMRSDSLFDILTFTGQQPDWMTQIDQIKDQIPYRELSFTNASGSIGKVQVTVQPFSSQDEERTWLIYFRDVTLEETLQKKYRAELDQKEDVIKELRKAQEALENYSKNLEQMVEDRTRELRSVNRTLSALLDSLGQGFFIFDKDGACLPVYSKACIDTLETEPLGCSVWDVLKIPENRIANFKKWIFALFSEMLPFDDIAALAPPRVEHTQGREIALSYYPIRDDQGAISHTVVMASDITAEVNARHEAEVERSRARKILKLISNLNRTHSFIRESQNLVQQLRLATNKAPNPGTKAEVFRLLHTLKGGMATFSLDEIKLLCHRAESALADVVHESSPGWQEVLRLSGEIDESFCSFVHDHRELLGENFSESERRISVRISTVLDLIHRLPQLNSIALKTELIHQLLLEPVGDYFAHYQTVIPEMAEAQNKKLAPLKMHNADVLVFGSYYVNLFETFIHLFRNSIDHGIEFPSERSRLGKTEEGHIELDFAILQRDQEQLLQIQVKDDGAGINLGRLSEKLRDRGIDTNKLTEHEILQHVFDSQLSTCDNVTDISGRGVGMDAVLNASRSLGGSAQVDSIPGQGIITTIVVPYLLPSDSTKKEAA